jgi:tRNA(fMet)-specific endonuclease VapC
MAYFLDADICIYAISGKYPRVNERIERAGRATCLSAIVVAELCSGAEKSNRPAYRAEVDKFLLNLEVRDFDESAGRHYGEIRAHLERRGTPIGSNDMLIAAHARSLGMTMVTNNMREFARVPNLKLENWLT